jgi:hypothetical protein
MANLTDNKANAKAEAGQRLIVPDVVLKTGIQMWQGGALFRNPADSGLLVTDPATSAMLDAYGVAATNQLGDGLRAGLLGVGCYEFDNSATSGETIPTYFPLGWPLYAKDNQTVSMTDGSGAYPKLGHFGGFASNGKPLVWVGFCPYAKDEITITRSIGHGDLTDADTTQSFDLYTLPGPAVVVGPPWIRSKTDFSGGGTGSATLAIGVGADVDALGDERDVFTGSTAAPAAMTAGVNGAAGYPLAATSVINLTVVADTTVAAFTAGVAVVSLRLKLGSY